MKELFDCTQGITDILVKLFFLTQIECLQRGAALSAYAVRNTFNMYFSRVRPVIEAVKARDYSYLEKYSDLAMTNEEYERHAENVMLQMEKEQEEQTAEQKSVDEAVRDEFENSAQKLAEKMSRLLQKRPDIKDGQQLTDLCLAIKEFLVKDPEFNFAKAIDLAATIAAKDESSGNDKL